MIAVSTVFYELLLDHTGHEYGLGIVKNFHPSSWTYMHSLLPFVYEHKRISIRIKNRGTDYTSQHKHIFKCVCCCLSEHRSKACLLLWAGSAPSLFVWHGYSSRTSRKSSIWHVSRGNPADVAALWQTSSKMCSKVLFFFLHQLCLSRQHCFGRSESEFTLLLYINNVTVRLCHSLVF